MERKYRNTSDGDFYPPGHTEPVTPGGTFTTSAPLAHEGALIDAGTLELAGRQQKLPCPACAEQDATKTGAHTPKFDTHDELVAHYQEQHGGLEPPAGEEE